MKLLLSLVVVVALTLSVHASPAAKVLDISFFQGTPSVSQFACWREQNYTRIILQHLRSNSKLSPAVAEQGRRAALAGLQVELYWFLNVKQTNATYDAAYAAAQALPFPWARIWMDVEAGFWAPNRAANANRLLAAVDRVQPAPVGVYSARAQWGNIMPPSFDSLADEPLWYAHYDNMPDFRDFVPFGGWSRPEGKQFKDDSDPHNCGFKADVNVFVDRE